MKLPNLSLKRSAPAHNSAKKAPQGTRAQGHWLGLYFLPGVIAGVLTLLVLALTVLGMLHQARTLVDKVGVRDAGRELARQIATGVDARREQLRVLASNPVVTEALSAGTADALAKATRQGAALLPGVRQLRLFVRGTEVLPEPTGPAPMGYIGVEMVEHALLGKDPRAEVQQLASKRPSLAIAVPVRLNGQVAGVLLGAWPVGLIRSQVDAVPSFHGELRLLQDGGVLLAHTGTGAREAARLGTSAVPGTLFNVVYRVYPTGFTHQLLPLATITGAGILVLLLAMVLQYHVLTRDLRQDMATLVDLGEAILSSDGSGERNVRVADAANAVLLLTDYARQSYRRAANTSPLGNHATQPVQAERAVARQASAPGPEDRVSAETAAETLPEVPETIFRAYDIRGLAGTELTSPLATLLGKAFAASAAKLTIGDVWIGHDPRVSSPELYEALAAGLMEQGMSVIGLGMVPIGLLYYAMHTRPNTATVMVTGSHNPADYNGFKLYLDGQSVHDRALGDLRSRMLSGRFERLRGRRSRSDIRPEYLSAVSSEVQLARSLRVVVDGGNGAAGEFACELLESLGCEVLPLFCEPDGSFPNHHPDPSQDDNLAALVLQVQATESDLGIAFDGDGDRLGLVDEKGEVVRPEHLLMLLAADVLMRNPGSDVIYDAKTSKHLAAYILGCGGRPIMAPAGHTRMKEKMRETGALIGGEYSGHYYIKERWSGSDDAIYVAARFLEVMAADPRPLSEQLADLPVSPCTGELQLPLDEGMAEALMRTIRSKAAFGDARIIDIDGLRVEFDDGWGLVRASNTQPALTFRFEADTESALEQVQQRFRELVKSVVPDRQLPF